MAPPQPNLIPQRAARGFTYLALIFTAACAHARPAPSQFLGLQGVVGEVPLTSRVPVFLGVFHANIHVPLVDVRVNGVKTRFIVDTGSTHNVVTTQLATELGIGIRRSSEAGRDHTGASVPVYDASPLRLALGSFERELRDVEAIEAPPPLEDLGIGGFLSPQTFIERGCVVLDLPGRRMLITTDGLDEVRRKHLPAHLRMTSIPRVRVPGVDDRKLLVTLAIHGREPAFAELDTGARRTELVASYLGIGPIAASARDGGIGVSGQRTKGELVDGQFVVFGSRTFGPMPVLARDEIRKDEGALDAILGMDLLERFILVIPAEPSEELLVFEWLDRAT